MIITWFLYATTFGFAIGLTTVLLDRAATLSKLPTRWLWVGAMALTSAVPIFVVAGPAVDAPETAAPFEITGRLAKPTLIEAAPTNGPVISYHALAERLANFDATAVVLWLSVSALMLLGLTVVVIRVHQASRKWQPDVVHDIKIRQTINLGPAVIGWFPPLIALPAWVRALDHDAQRIIVAHEYEHQRAGDTWIVGIATLLVAVQPWNMALWWLRWRLRHSVERDCDGRVVRRGIQPSTYATLLYRLLKQDMVSPRLALALGRPKSRVGRRIQHVLAERPTTWRRRALIMTLAAAATVVVACTMPTPPHVTERTAFAHRQEMAFEQPMDSRSGAVRSLGNLLATLADSTDYPTNPSATITALQRLTNDLNVERRKRQINPAELKATPSDGNATTNRLESHVLDKKPASPDLTHARPAMASDSLSSHQRRIVPMGHTTRPTLRMAPLVACAAMVAGCDAATMAGVEVSGDTITVSEQAVKTVLTSDVVKTVLTGKISLRPAEQANSDFAPLFYIDGVKLERGTPLQEFSPDEIESIEVIKGPAAARLYGAEAVDGVVRLVTKDDPSKAGRTPSRNNQ